MPFLFVVLYGLLSGFFDVLPVSSLGHQDLLCNIFGVEESLHLYKFLVHLASLAALIFASMPSITSLLREQRILSLPHKRMQGERKFTYELRFVKTVIFTVTIMTVLTSIWGNRAQSLLTTGILFVVNGVIILVPEYLPVGNKSAKHLNRLDATAFGALSGFGIFPGISRIATMQCYGSLRGADRSRICNWVVLAMIPALAVMTFLDLIAVFTAGAGVASFLSFLSFLLGAILSFIGTFSGITLIRFLSAKVGFVGFGYYSIGAGLLTFFLYLTA